jgi:hypothetical protein
MSREFSVFLTTKPLTRNQFTVSEYAPKLNYSNVEIKKFSADHTPDSQRFPRGDKENGDEH